MKLDVPTLFTPFYLKLNDDMPWPEQEKVFYLLTREGCFLCRNHPFFRSSVAAETLPELGKHKPFLRLHYPKLAQRQFERVIGFFAVIGERYSAEAAVLLVWNTSTRAVELVVPPQRSVVSSSWNGRPYPVEVHYEVPTLPPHLLLVGDIHSHVDGAAYASFTDRADEAYRPGLHVVVGRISAEPPEWHVAAVVDGVRFRIKSVFDVVQGYTRRRLREVPQAWLDQVQVMTWSEYNNYKSSCRQEAEVPPSTRSERDRLESWLQQHATPASPTLAPGPDNGPPPTNGAATPNRPDGQDLP
jgi:hypothetical protein